MAWYDNLTTNSNQQVTTPPVRRTLTGNQNSLKDVFEQINNVETNVDTSARDNFDTKSYFDPLKRKFNSLNGGAIQKSDIQKISDMRPDNPYESGIKTGLDKLQQFTDENSDTYKNIFNRSLDRFDATAAIANKNQAQKISANPFASESAKRAGVAELNRVTQSNRATLAGDTSQAISKMVMDASNNFVSQSINASEYEEGKFRTDAGLALQEMSNKVQTLQAEGALTQAEASMEYSKVNDTINDKFRNVASQFEKLGLIQNNANYQIQAEQIKTQMFDFWADKSINSVLGLKQTNGGATTVDQVKSDPRTLSYLEKEWEMIGEGEIPDEYIQSRIDSAKTTTQINQESQQELVNSYTSLGMSPEMASQAAQSVALVKMGLDKDESGNFTLANADGSPRYTFKTDPATGKVTMVRGDGTTSEGKAKAGEIFTDEKSGKVYVKGSEGNIEVKPDDIVNSNGTLYTNKDGEISVVSTVPADVWGPDANDIFEKGEGTKVYDSLVDSRVKDITETNNWVKLSKMSVDDPVYKKYISDVDKANYALNVKKHGTDTITTDLREGDVTKIEYKGKPIPVKVHSIGKIDNSMNYDDVFITFEGPDGKLYVDYTESGTRHFSVLSGKLPQKYIPGNKNIK
jgi:hypothetical protein